MSALRETHTGLSGRALRRCLAVVLLAAAGWAAAPPSVALAENSAVVLMYHRFGEGKYPSTNITIAQFEAHIRELKSGKYTVLPVPEILEALRRGTPLPERTVGLTIDDAYLSVYTRAWPRLKAAGFPFTLFVATDPLDRKQPDFMTWDNLREMAGAGVTIGRHTASHLHMPTASGERNSRDMARADARFRANLGMRPKLFAYPYGEASLAIQKLVRGAGLTAAFGQHSGAVGGADNFFYLPRFAMNEKYGDLSRFRLVANTLALPVTDMVPADPLITGPNPPAIGFTVIGNVTGLQRLTCFASHEGRAKIERLGTTRIEVRVGKPFPKGRTRLNCTMPAKDGRWRWLGRLYYVPR
ncbi:MAG: polysaccharide deacetylase family protein [Rhodospirillales bacterium]